MKCPRLHTVVLPQSLRTIGWRAFCNCNSLRLINIPSVTRIGDCAFSETAIESIILPPSVRTIGRSVFAYCSALKSVNLPPSATIAACAFMNCPALKSINVYPSVTLGEYAFHSCESLASLAGCDAEDSEAIEQYLRFQTSRILLRYSVLMAIKRVQTGSSDNYERTSRARRREVARAKPSTDGLNGNLAFEYLTFGNGEIWRQVLEFL